MDRRPVHCVSTWTCTWVPVPMTGAMAQRARAAIYMATTKRSELRVDMLSSEKILGLIISFKACAAHAHASCQRARVRGRCRSAVPAFCAVVAAT